MPRPLALIFSYLFHPLWMPLVVFCAAVWLDPFLMIHPAVMPLLIGILVVNAVAPGISFLVMMRIGMITSAELYQRKERFVPFVLILFYFTLSYVILRVKWPYPSESVLSMFSALIAAVVLAFVVTFWWKISVHSLSMGGLVGTLIGLAAVHQLSIFGWIALSVILAGCVAASRLSLKAHDPMQTYLGFLLGVLVHYFFLRYQLYF